MTELDDTESTWIDQREIDDPPPDLAAPHRRLIDPRTLPARIHHLRAAGQSGAHCLYSFQGDGSDTLARRLGSGAHGLLLGKPVALWDQTAKSGKGKAKRDPRSDAWTAFQAQNAGAVILNAKEMDAARRMVDAIRAHGPADRLLSAPNVVTERPIIWAQSGRARQSTPDLRRRADASGPSFNVEIKTTRCAAPWAFGRDAERLTYHAQLADQAAAIAYEWGAPPSESLVIAVENSRPHVVQVYEVPRKLLELGAQLIEQWMERLQVYEATDLWTGYSPRVEELSFPERGTWAVALEPDGDEEDAAAD